MSRVFGQFLVTLVLLLGVAVSAPAQTTGSISGFVQDEKEAALPNATVTARNVETNFSRTAQTNDEGRYNFANLPVGAYEITVEASNFSKYVQSGITLSLNQAAVVDVTMKLGGVSEVVNVTENAALLNTATAEVSTRFDTRRVSELPLAPNRNVFNVVLSAPGVSQLGSGQTGFANGISFSSNGGRLRSNNFMIDGQDINDPSVAGGQQAINNPDIVQEVRLITNQFLAEYGRNSGSVLNIITKAGTNDYHGTAFWFYNGNALNACNNLNKTGGFCRPKDTTLAAGQSYKRPFRIENQLGFTIGGPLHLPRFGEGGPTHISGRDRTFFFGSYQRWSDRQLGSGFTLIGAPTAAGRQALQAAAGDRPQVAALLKFLPAAQDATGPTVNFRIGNGPLIPVTTGRLTGAASNFLDDHQASFRVDHRINDANNLNVRYLYDDQDTGGTGQVTPTGLTTKNVFRSQAANGSLVSVITPNLVNAVRAAWSRLATTTASDDPSSELIPSIEINELGLQGFNAAANRTAIGLAVNLPQFRNNNTYQVQNNLTWTKGSHAMKFGVDIRRTQVKSFFVPTIRGRLAYSTLQNFVNDVADLASQVNRPLPGGQEIQYYYYYDQYYYAQDQWKLRPNFTLTYGLRYELPGNNFDDLVPVNDAIVAAAGNDERFRFTPVPGADKNNFQPRIGFNWNPRTEGGALGWLTGGDKLVIRGGYARTHDSNFININLNIASAFPFVAAINLPAAGAFAAIPTAQPAGLNPATFARTIVAEDFRAPVYDQFSLEMQRELTSDLVLKVGYVGTRGRDLFQTIDGNPRLATNNISISDSRFTTIVTPERTAALAPGSPNNPCRVTVIDATNCTRGVVRLRANGAESEYHSMQVSLDKRLSRGFSAGVHYTWSSFIDTASELFNPSGGEVAVAQNSFDPEADRARSTYDRPHRLSGNFVYELPFFREQKGLVGHVLGGWQLNGFFTFQSGAPFTPLNGSDPTGALNGIDGLVGNAVRANSIAPLPTTNTEELFNLIRQEGQQFFRTLQCTGPVDSAGRFLPSATCERFGSAGRNILRADGIGNLDFGIIKNTRIAENVRLQLRADMFNATNTRNFGVPTAAVNSGAFLNQWTTNGGNRRIIVGARLVF